MTGSSFRELEATLMGQGLVTLYLIVLPACIYMIMGWDTIWYVMGQVSGQGPITDVRSSHDSQFCRIPYFHFSTAYVRMGLIWWAVGNARGRYSCHFGFIVYRFILLSSYSMKGIGHGR